MVVSYVADVVIFINNNNQHRQQPSPASTRPLELEVVVANVERLLLLSFLSNKFLGRFESCEHDTGSICLVLWDRATFRSGFEMFHCRSARAKRAIQCDRYIKLAT